MGDVDLSPPNTGTFFHIAAVDVHSGYDDPTHRNDLAMLMLATPAPFEPMRVVRTNESALWAGGTLATIIGWGITEPGNPSAVSNVLLETKVPMITDNLCYSQYGADFELDTMVCAYDGVHDACHGDSGGPLMVPNPAGGLVLAGVTSWGNGCAAFNFAGVYARLGGAALNGWVMARHPWTTFVVPPLTHSGSSVTFTESSFHPLSGHGFTTFNWDLNGNGQYDDAQGRVASRIFATGGNQTVGLEATNAAGDRMVSRQVVAVNGTPSASAGPVSGYSVREGGSVELIGMGSDPEGQALAYSWNLNGDGAFEVSSRTTAFSALQLDGPTTKTAALRVCDSAGGCSASAATVRVTNAPPRANAGPDRRARRGTRLRFRMRATDPGRDRLRVLWRFGDGRRASGVRVAHRYRRPGRYMVTAIVIDDDGARATDKVRVRVARR
jgi:hypothetical protein